MYAAKEIYLNAFAGKDIKRIMVYFCFFRERNCSIRSQPSDGESSSYMNSWRGMRIRDIDTETSWSSDNFSRP
ncbi:hypothetical protein MA16_Dca007253 [Dendrobium catenatum]|uniref:Uncharacterized protein n=1 Tax=Dendrobium catenatum TaxID=906689 RepID=A0A2I0W6H5_9ASPA|nr:hypothetical protein MA16_Dca007253 [Dendrobium catenatum]